MSLTVPTVAAACATEVEATDEGSDNVLCSAFTWTMFMFGVFVGSTGHFYYLKLVPKLWNVAEKPVRDFGTVTDPVSTPTTSSPSSSESGPVLIATRCGVCYH